MTSILIMDRELGFMWALAQGLKARGIDAIPSSSVKEAQSVLEALQPQLTLAIINCRCQGACAFSEELRKTYDPLRIIGIVSRGFRCSHCAHRFIATLHDPDDHDPGRLAHCIELVDILANSVWLQRAPRLQ